MNGRHKRLKVCPPVCEHERGIQNWGESERMPKSGLFSVCLLKHMPSIANVFLFEVPTPNSLCLAVHWMFATQTNAVGCALATHPHQHLSQFCMSHSAFAYRCGCGIMLFLFYGRVCKTLKLTLDLLAPYSPVTARQPTMSIFLIVLQHNLFSSISMTLFESYVQVPKLFLISLIFKVKTIYKEQGLSYLYKIFFWF